MIATLTVGGKKPASVSVTLFGGIIAALAALTAALNSLTRGEEFLKSKLVDELGVDAQAISPELLNLALTEARDTLESRAYVWLFLAFALALIHVTGRRGAVWSSVLITLTSIAVLALAALDLGDTVPDLNKAMALLTALAALVSTITAWAPSRRRYHQSFRHQSS